MVIEINEKYALDVRGGSFCIYCTSTLRSLCSGDVDNFNSQEEMVDHAVRKFYELAK